MGIRDHLSLFSGIGGLDLAAEWAGFRTVAFVERDKYCQRVLARHWPGVPIYEDVADVGYSSIVQRDGGKHHGGREKECRPEAPESRDADCSPLLISGGFPCQPHSVAGKRKASGDERDLWHECARIVGEFRPRWAVFENVPGLLSSERGTFFARVLGDLAALGYRVGWGVWGANDVGALHRRDRVFIVAHAASAGCSGSRECGKRGGDSSSREREANHAFAERIGDFWRIEPNVGRVAYGVPSRVDRLRALGNAVVPQQAYPIFKAIAEIEGINV